MTTESAVYFARDLARHDSPKLAEIGRMLLSIKSDEDLVLAVRMIQTIAPALR